MEGPVVYLMVGGILVVTGMMMMRAHVATWRAEKNDPTVEDDQRVFLYKRYRRRMQTSALIAAIGILIPFGSLVLPGLFAEAQQQMWILSFFWGSVLLLTMFVILLGFGDLLSTAAQSRVAMSRIRLKQRELEQELAEIRRRHSNGHKSE